MSQGRHQDNKLRLVLIGLAILTVICLIVGIYGWSYVAGLFAERTDVVRP
jgi:hypothetical protein